MSDVKSLQNAIVIPYYPVVPGGVRVPSALSVVLAKIKDPVIGRPHGFLSGLYQELRNAGYGARTQAELMGICAELADCVKSISTLNIALLGDPNALQLSAMALGSIDLYTLGLATASTNGVLVGFPDLLTAYGRDQDLYDAMKKQFPFLENIVLAKPKIVFTDVWYPECQETAALLEYPTVVDFPCIEIPVYVSGDLSALQLQYDFSALDAIGR